jgi:hypothetical protein
MANKTFAVKLAQDAYTHRRGHDGGAAISRTAMMSGAAGMSLASRYTNGGGSRPLVLVADFHEIFDFTSENSEFH